MTDEYSPFRTTEEQERHRAQRSVDPLADPFLDLPTSHGDTPDGQEAEALCSIGVASTGVSATGLPVRAGGPATSSASEQMGGVRFLSATTEFECQDTKGAVAGRSCSSEAPALCPPSVCSLVTGLDQPGYTLRGQQGASLRPQPGESVPVGSQPAGIGMGKKNA